MGYLLKLLFLVFRELIFDNKDEYDTKSAKFNARKFIVLILIMLSFALNIWLMWRFTDLAGDFIKYKTEARENKALLEVCYSTYEDRKPPPKAIKKP